MVMMVFLLKCECVKDTTLDKLKVKYKFECHIYTVFLLKGYNVNNSGCAYGQFVVVFLLFFCMFSVLNFIHLSAFFFFSFNKIVAIFLLLIFISCFTELKWKAGVQCAILIHFTSSRDFLTIKMYIIDKSSWVSMENDSTKV